MQTPSNSLVADCNVAIPPLSQPQKPLVASNPEPVKRSEVKTRPFLGTFADRLHTLRWHSGLSQTELGQLIGVTKKSISKMERGLTKPTDQHALALARVFGVGVTWLRWGDELRRRAA